MEQVKRFGAGVLASVLAVSMLQTMVFAVDTAPDKQKIAGFVQAGQEIGEVSFTLGQEESELTAQMPQTISVSAEDGSEQQLPVTWTTQADYANSDDFYYAFVPQWMPIHTTWHRTQRCRIFWHSARTQPSWSRTAFAP